ncbi:MAG: prolyl oligopeptidase family serine peptidase [Planctomycetes bacterium]|nr:prolyl oligopeptidase family serine peptidase [Planctomycetota bacterium]MCH9724898.1 prolyl oligopeptidase family serine peptidase [Planctomycetota bacterium]MCH9776857.1 prolyl oligopeptidase family serine peptidase [Planctomycetota bacterium]MCH9792228.1 prolyl oligopeptidase family serine peptidase [Planctomycetota bacterium]
MHRLFSIIVLSSVLAVSVYSEAAEDLNVLPEATGNVAEKGPVYHALQQQSYEASAKRTAAYEALKTPADCVAYQKRMKEFFRKQIGGFPEKTPLNPRVIGKLKGKGFRVENVIYESWPGHHVTANLYLPNSKPPYPGVLVPCGHSHNGKVAGAYQQACMLLAQNGMAALCYDPIGQGERYQVLSKQPNEFFRGTKRYRPPHPQVQFYCTAEHTLMSVSSIPLGSNSARYRIWDGMRSIDYLVSRPDIDPNRIGCTGNSGGGTLTSYIMALDERVKCAAPVCYSTMYRYLVDNNGPQDGEQVIFGQLANGMDIADYTLMRAPKPTLICAGTHDSTFKIAGTWELFREAKRFYTRMGYAERVGIIEADAPHGFTIQLREAAARWMSRWLLNKENPIFEGELPVFTYEELQCSQSGQILLDAGERSLFEINDGLNQQLAKERAELWNSGDLKTLRDQVREVCGVQKLSALLRPEFNEVGTIQRPGYQITKLIIKPAHGVPLPALLFQPKKQSGELVLYLHGEGKQVDAGEGAAIEQRVKQGDVVLALDIRCIGETERKNNRRVGWAHGLLGPNYHEFALAYLLGDSMVKLRAEDILVAARFLSEYQSKDKPQKVELTAIGETAIPALHAAAMEPEQFSQVNLSQMIPSWGEVVKTPETHNQLINTVHGALKVYDLPNLIKLVDTSKVKVTQPAGVTEKVATKTP